MLSEKIARQLYDLTAQGYKGEDVSELIADRYEMKAPGVARAIDVLTKIKWGRYQSAETSRGLAWNLTVTLPGVGKVTYIDDGDGGEAQIDVKGGWIEQETAKTQLAEMARLFFVREDAGFDELFIMLSDMRERIAYNRLLTHANDPKVLVG